MFKKLITSTITLLILGFLPLSKIWAQTYLCERKEENRSDIFYLYVTNSQSENSVTVSLVQIFTGDLPPRLLTGKVTEYDTAIEGQLKMTSDPENDWDHFEISISTQSEDADYVIDRLVGYVKDEERAGDNKLWIIDTSSKVKCNMFN